MRESLNIMSEAESFRSLLLSAGAGDDRAAAELLQLYGPAVVVAVRRVLAKELRSRFDSSDFAQAVWASFFANRSKFETILAPDELIRHLSAMARNKVVDEFRRRCQLQKNNIHREKSLNGTVPGETHDVEDDSSSPSQIAVANELWQRVLANRAPQEQAILELRRTGFTQKEIADRIGISERTVRRLICRVFEEQATC